jgi:hypothetical protein
VPWRSLAVWLALTAVAAGLVLAIVARPGIEPDAGAMAVAAREPAGALQPPEAAAGSPAATPTARRAESFLTGVSHTDHSLQPWSDPRTTRLAERILRRAAPVQNVFLMGWGSTNPEPAPGKYDWSSLDYRIDLIRRTGGIPVVTLCGAPDWMKGGAAGKTNWKDLGDAPTPDHYDDFAALAVAVAERYPSVRHFTVWSELRGFFDAASNTWDIRAYTEFYNTVYTALKAHDPALSIGGPNPVMDSWADVDGMSSPSAVRGPWGVLDRRALDALEYWLDHKVGAQFLTLNATTANRRTGRGAPVPVAVEKFVAINEWIRQRTDLPIWYMEVYSPAADRAPTSFSNWIAATPNSIDRALAAIRDSGASAALLWDPEGTRSRCTNCLWTSPKTPGGATRTKFAGVLERYARTAR